MRITDVRVRKVEKEGKMRAVVSITIDDEFVVHDIKVIEGVKGLFIAMPSRKAADGEFRDIAHPINSETRDRIQGIILDEYRKQTAVDDGDGQTEQSMTPKEEAKEEQKAEETVQEAAEETIAQNTTANNTTAKEETEKI